MLARRAQTRLVLLLALAWVACGSGHAPTSPTAAGVLAFGLYDDFESGAPHPSRWSTPDAGEVVRSPVAGEEHGRVWTLPGTDANTAYYLELLDPRVVYPAQFRSWSADVLLEDSGCSDQRLGLNYMMGLSSQGGAPWYAQIRLTRQSRWGRTAIRAGYFNAGTMSGDYVELSAAIGTWYALRMDIVTLSPRELRIDYFVDADLVGSMSPPEGPELLDRDRIEIPPWRNISASRRGCAHLRGYLDNVHAVREGSSD